MFGMIITQLVAYVSALNRFGSDASNPNMTALKMHNVGFEAKFFDTDNESQSYENGVALFENMVEIVNDICSNETNLCEYSKEFESLSCYAFRVITVTLPKTQPLCLERLYFYFDQQRTLVPPFAYNEYNDAFLRGDLDKCYKILNSVFGKISSEEVAYLGAYAVRDRLGKGKGKGILFLDTVSGKIFFLGRNKKASYGGKSKILIIPNGFLNFYKFLTYSLNLIDKMVAQSEYVTKIHEVYNGLIGIKTGSGENITVNVDLCEMPVCKIIAYKFFVYNVMSMEVCGVSKDVIIEWINQYRTAVFIKVGRSTLRIKLDSEFMTYLKVVVLAKGKL